MANTFITNKLATATAVRSAENMAYAMVGSRAYFQGQIAGKNNGQTYTFYVRDTGDAVNRLEVDDSDKTTLTERKVDLSLEPWHVFVTINEIEKQTDIENWEDEIARPNGIKLAQGMIKKLIDQDLGKAATAYIGAGFTPLSQASAHVGSIANGDVYGFVSPQIEAVLTANGQQFVPVDAPDMYSKGLLGRFQTLHAGENAYQEHRESGTSQSVFKARFRALQHHAFARRHQGGTPETRKSAGNSRTARSTASERPVGTLVAD